MIPATLAADLPLYALYALAGTSAASLARASIQRAEAKAWRAAALRMAAGCACLAVAIGLLPVLLGSADLSVMAPVAIAMNLTVALLISVIVLKERVDRWKLAGFALIVAGVVLVA